ncbi:hypothetical protein [Kitasatospora sp. NPDC001527]|uniref:hypothetical protein n=1 Tax=Kitasatospora sp. NPDC001527 TaxID=3154519 RepID=UPI003316CCF2
MTPHPLPAVRGGAVTASGAGQPPRSLAEFIRPGDHVLHVGPGTAALQLAEWTGHPVTSVHATLADVEEVRAALGPAGRTAGTVDAVVGELFDGRPDRGPYDVLLVTAAVPGLSPRWLDQLAPGGVIVAPLTLGGLHPWVVCGHDKYDGLLYGSVLAADLPDAGPRPAPGVLFATKAGPAAEPLPCPRWAPQWAGVTPPRITPQGYVDLWAWLAARDDRITAARAEGTDWGPGCALVVGNSAVHVRPDGLWLSDTNPATLALAQVVGEDVQAWGFQRRPPATGLTCRLSRQPDAAPDDLVAAAGWSTSRPVTVTRRKKETPQ